MTQLVYYSGHVQGVGFRATAAALARRYAVAGWVRNLPDRRVELLAEGEPGEVLAFLADVRTRMADHITNEDLFDRDPEGVVGFVIR
ncbi:MAG: acylphosphatase [Fimbriiglobus sp.]|jgi:acylphosphatase|nr:acylphosphatase [Fimbriiglobus sp.]